MSMSLEEYMDYRSDEVVGKIKKLMDADHRVMEVWHYPEGFVSNAYDYPAPGHRFIYDRDMKVSVDLYDRKRSYGRGPTCVAKSEKLGCLKSW